MNEMNETEGKQDLTSEGKQSRLKNEWGRGLE